MSKNNRELYNGTEWPTTQGDVLIITNYVTNKEVYVKFKDGTVLSNPKTMSDIKKGFVTNPNHSAAKWIGQKKVMNNGREVEIVGWGNKGHSVKYKLDNGKIVETNIGNFIAGNIGDGIKRRRWTKEEDEAIITGLFEGLLDADAFGRTASAVYQRCEKAIIETPGLKVIYPVHIIVEGKQTEDDIAELYKATHAHPNHFIFEKRR